ncbi:MAG TPA: M56 family metallopeptidase [Vicinamibacterales bacterium]
MMPFAVLTLLKATLVCGAAFFLSRLCRRARASVRHMVFALAFAALVVIPFAATMLPAVQITVPVTAKAPALPAPDMTPPVRSRGGSVPTDSTTPFVASRAKAADPVTVTQLVTAIWLTGVAVFLVPVMIGFWQMRGLRESARPWTDGEALARAFVSTPWLHRPIEVLIHDAVTGPLTCGVLKPSIILPASARQWDAASVRCALRHELEHVARRDFLTHCVSRIVCAAYWFHPLVWAAWRRLRLEAERACDDAVLRESDAGDYASLLVSIAQRGAADTRQPVLAMAGHHDLAARVVAVLNDSQVRGRVQRRSAILSIATAAMVTLGVAPITVGRAMPQTQATIATAPRLRFDTVSLKRNQGNDRSIMYFTGDAGGRPGVGADGRVQSMTATNMTARFLLWNAYRLELTGDDRADLHQIDNAPEWIDSDRFDLVAKAASRSMPQEMHEMMQSLLAERFKLVAHLGSREFPIYALVSSRSDGNLGPRMAPSQIDCTSMPGASSPCGLSGTSGRLVGRGLTLAQLINVLPNHLGGGGHRVSFDRRVIDGTGLSGAFDFTVEWTPDTISQELRAPSAAAPRLEQYREFARPIESNAPNFVKALHEQLGLMLETRWTPEPVLVIDQIERPVEN